MRSAASEAFLKCALKPSRSDGRLIFPSWLGSLPGSHEPWAAMMTGARRTASSPFEFDMDRLHVSFLLDAGRAPRLENFGTCRPRRL